MDYWGFQDQLVRVVAPQEPHRKRASNSKIEKCAKILNYWFRVCPALHISALVMGDAYIPHACEPSSPDTGDCIFHCERVIRTFLHTSH